ncbi:MAG: hypothetical protein M1151_02820 [Candidatus Thermoplasmatota archaeon]|jgi:Ni,Fe-hydrogenase III large subunit|nr:hypothetical protein [Candidatus Thermoplasmatota archaeon]MCL5785587.1 hypothetical protein [Candidatus Thermoplasmatota archaeon]
MVGEDVITGVLESGGGECEITSGFGIPSWKKAAGSDIDGREDFKACVGRFDEKAEGTDVFNFTYGPSAGGLNESCKFNIYTYGERILSLRPEPAYKDRRLEVSGSGLVMAILRLERYCGPLSPFYSGMFAAAVEAIMGNGENNDLRLARVIMNEVGRISDHLYVIAKLAEGASQNVAYNLLFGLREKLLRLVSRRFGHRYFFGINGFGGLARSADFGGISSEVGAIAEEFRQLWIRLENSGIFIDRIQGTATLRRPWMVGPAARAAGLRTDTRIDGSCLRYDDLDLEVASAASADTLARSLVRKDEIFASARIIEKAESMIREVPAAVRMNLGEISGEISVRTETPGGDSLMRVSLANGVVKKIYIRPSSLQNLAVFTYAIKENLLTDFTFGYEGLGIHVSELGGVL